MGCAVITLPWLNGTVETMLRSITESLPIELMYRGRPWTLE